MTSHIIQDIEKLVDDCIIMDYGKILFHDKIGVLTGNLVKYTYMNGGDTKMPSGDQILNPSEFRGKTEFYSFAPENEIRSIMKADGIETESLKSEKMNLEDAFIGLTGKY